MEEGRWWSVDEQRVEDDLPPNVKDLLMQCSAASCATVAAVMTMTSRGEQEGEVEKAALSTAANQLVAEILEKSLMLAAEPASSINLPPSAASRQSMLLKHYTVLSFSVIFSSWQAIIQHAPVEVDEEMQSKLSARVALLIDGMLVALLNASHFDILAHVLFRVLRVDEDEEEAKKKKSSSLSVLQQLEKRQEEILTCISDLWGTTLDDGALANVGFASALQQLWRLAAVTFDKATPAELDKEDEEDEEKMVLQARQVVRAVSATVRRAGSCKDIPVAKVWKLAERWLRRAAKSFSATPSKGSSTCVEILEASIQLNALLYEAKAPEDDDAPLLSGTLNSPSAAVLVGREWNAVDSSLKRSVVLPSASLPTLFTQIVALSTSASPNAAGTATLLEELLVTPVAFFLKLFRAIAEPAETSISSSVARVVPGLTYRVTGDGKKVMLAAYADDDTPQAITTEAQFNARFFERHVQAFAAVEKLLLPFIADDSSSGNNNILALFMAAAAGALDVLAARTPCVVEVLMFLVHLSYGKKLHYQRQQQQGGGGGPADSSGNAAEEGGSNLRFFTLLASKLVGEKCSRLPEYLHTMTVKRKCRGVVGLLLPLLHVFAGSELTECDADFLYTDVPFPISLTIKYFRSLPRPFFATHFPITPVSLAAEASTFVVEVLLRDAEASRLVSETVMEGALYLLGGGSNKSSAVPPSCCEDASSMVAIDTMFSVFRFLKVAEFGLAEAEKFPNLNGIAAATKAALQGRLGELKDAMNAAAAAIGATPSAAAIHMRSVAAMLSTPSGYKLLPPPPPPAATGEVPATSGEGGAAPVAASTTASKPSPVPKQALTWFWAGDFGSVSTFQFIDALAINNSCGALHPYGSKHARPILQELRSYREGSIAKASELRKVLGHFASLCAADVRGDGRLAVKSASDVNPFLRGMLQPLVLRSSFSAADAHFCVKVVQTMWSGLRCTPPGGTKTSIDDATSSSSSKVPLGVFEDFMGKDIPRQVGELAANGTVSQCRSAFRFLQNLVEEIVVPWAKSTASSDKDDSPLLSTEMKELLAALQEPTARSAGSMMRHISQEVVSCVERCLGTNSFVGDCKAYHIVYKCKSFLGCLTQPKAAIATAIGARKAKLVAAEGRGISPDHPISLLQNITLLNIAGGEACTDSIDVFRSSFDRKRARSKDDKERDKDRRKERPSDKKNEKEKDRGNGDGKDRAKEDAKDRGKGDAKDRGKEDAKRNVKDRAREKSRKRSHGKAKREKSRGRKKSRGRRR